MYLKKMWILLSEYNILKFQRYLLLLDAILLNEMFESPKLQMIPNVKFIAMTLKGRIFFRDIIKPYTVLTNESIFSIFRETYSSEWTGRSQAEFQHFQQLVRTHRASKV